MEQFIPVEIFRKKGNTIPQPGIPGKWYSSIRSVSSVRKSTVPFVKKKSAENSVQMVSAPGFSGFGTTNHTFSVYVVLLVLMILV